MSSFKETPKVAVVIHTWNGFDWLPPCLDSLLATKYGNFSLYMVDNGSTDGSQDLVQKRCPSVKIIRNQKYLGSAEGFNVGARCALQDGADYVALLHDDTKVDPGWLSPLVEISEADSTIGVLSPVQWDYEVKGFDAIFEQVICGQTRYLEDSRKGILPTFYETEWVLGSAMMMSRSVCEGVGLLGPLHFKHHEDTDLCRRARYHGFRIAVATKSHIFHHSRRPVSGHQQEAPFLQVRNVPLYIWKNPFWSTWKRFKAYVGFGMKFSGVTGWPIDLRHTLSIVYIQLWILAHLPVILFKARKEQKGACYLD